MNSGPNNLDAASGGLILAPDEILVRAIGLDAAAFCAEEFRRFLTDDERRRAERVLTKRQGSTFALVRAELRKLLSLILFMDPLLIRIEYGPHGKPCVPGQSAGRVLKFNVSHTASRALIAAAWNREVGVDIEAVRDWEAAPRIARRFFSQAENEALKAIPEEKRARAFFACWTRKEAFVKALGKGFTIPLGSYSVAVDPDEPARLIDMPSDPGAPGRWRMLDLPVPAPHIACLAAEGRDWTLRFEKENS